MTTNKQFSLTGTTFHDSIPQRTPPHPQCIAIGTDANTHHDADFRKDDSMIAVAITEDVATETTVMPPLSHGVPDGGKLGAAPRLHAMRDEIVWNPLL